MGGFLKLKYVRKICRVPFLGEERALTRFHPGSIERQEPGSIYYELQDQLASCLLLKEMIGNTRLIIYFKTEYFPPYIETMGHR